MTKIIRSIIAACALFAAPVSLSHAATGFLPGGNGVLSDKTLTPASNSLFDSSGRPTGAMSPSSLYTGAVSALTVATPGAYAPADLPVTLTAPSNSIGETATASVATYTAVTATVASAGNACSASSVFTIAATGTKIIVSDGDALSGSVITISVAGSGASSVIPTNPVTPTSTESDCTPPTFTMSWGVNTVSLTNAGWGYTSAPTFTGSTSTSSDATAASVTSTITTASVNLSSKLVATSRIGAANGVASLDSAGNVIAPIDSNSADANILRSGIYAGGKSYAGTEAASPIISLFTNASKTGSTFDLPGDSPPYDRAFLLGGQHADAKAFQWTFGQPDSTGLGAVVDFVAMNGMSAGQGTGVTAGGFSTMVAYGGYDAAARATRTGSSPPKFIASAAVTDPDGTAHTVTFSATGATFSPALPAYWGRMIHVGMNVGTNEIGATTIAPNTWNMPWTSTGWRKSLNMYFGTIESWAANSDGTISGITVDGWVVPDQSTAGYGSTNGKVPGTDTLDGSTPALDTTFTSISSPAILFGIYTKAFYGYELCDLSTNTRGDINNPNGDVGNLVHECDDEVDLWSGATTDYTDSIHGRTYTITAGAKLTNDSYGVAVQGGGELPVGFMAWNLIEGSPAYQAITKGSTVQTDIFAPYAIGTAVGSTSVLQTWGNELVKGGANTSTLRLIQYRDVADTAVATETNSVAQANVSLHLQWRLDSTVDPKSESGAIGAQIVYNPNGYLYGLGIGAGGTFKTPNYSIIVANGGALTFPLGGSVSNGNGMGFIPTTGDTAGHPYIAADSSSILHVKTTSGGEGSLTYYNAVIENTLAVTGSATLAGGATIGAGQGVGMIPSAGDSSGHPYLYAESASVVHLKTSAGGDGSMTFYDGIIEDALTVVGNTTLTGTTTLTGAATFSAAASFNGGAAIGAGYGLGAIPAAGDTAGHPYILADSASIFHVKTTAGGEGSLTYYNAVVENTLAVTGASTLTGGATIGAGNGVGLIPASGDGAGHPYFYATGSADLKAATSSGGIANLTANLYTETLTTPASSTATCTAGQFTDDTKYHYVCTATNTWKQAELKSATAPVIASGFGTSPTVTATNGATAFSITVGTSPTSTGTITLPAATTGWACDAQDVTTTSASVFLTKETAKTATSVTLTDYNTSGVASAWTAGDVLVVKCADY